MTPPGVPNYNLFRVRHRAQVHAHALQADGALGQRVGAGGAAAQGQIGRAGAVEQEGLAGALHVASRNLIKFCCFLLFKKACHLCDAQKL